MDSFLDVYGDAPILHARRKSKEAQRLMLLLVADIANYVSKHTKTGIFGAFLLKSIHAGETAEQRVLSRPFVLDVQDRYQ